MKKAKRQGSLDAAIEVAEDKQSSPTREKVADTQVSHSTPTTSRYLFSYTFTVDIHSTSQLF